MSFNIIALGDIHGNDYWKEAVEENRGCKFVFLGDYFDPYEAISREDLLENFQQILQFKKDKTDDVILLLGNHDLHYFSDKAEPCTRWDYRMAATLEELFTENRGLFQYAWQTENYIFAHAGISQKWFAEDFKGNTDENIAFQLNNPTKQQEETLFYCGQSRGGFHRNGGIFWADRTELSEPLPGYTQIVGHNRMLDIVDYKSKNGGRIIFCDCLFKKIYLKI